MQQFSQHPDKMDQIMDFVIKKVEHFTEFRTKKEHLKEKYDHKLKDLYAEYMEEQFYILTKSEWEYQISLII